MIPSSYSYSSFVLVVLISGLLFSLSPTASNAALTLDVIGIPTSSQSLSLEELPFQTSGGAATCGRTIDCQVTPIRDCVCKNVDFSCCVGDNKGEDWTRISCAVSLFVVC